MGFRCRVCRTIHAGIALVVGLEAFLITASSSERFVAGTAHRVDLIVGLESEAFITDYSFIGATSLHENEVPIVNYFDSPKR